jgi:hypothetical protein
MNNDSLPAEDPGPGRALRLATEFWMDAGGPPGFPRDPEPLIGFHLPVAVIGRPALTCGVVAAWAAANDLPAVPAAPDRALRGCLLAFGDAYLLVDADDPPAQRRVTVAHELGHYLIEVRQPRHRVARAVGPDALAVLDGQRAPVFEERLLAVLGDAPLRPLVHLMAREEDGSIGCARVAAAECAADTFALELLAPRESLRAAVEALAGLPLQQRWALTTDRLVRDYGLSLVIAAGYAPQLVQAFTGGESVREWLGLPTARSTDERVRALLAHPMELLF